MSAALRAAGTTALKCGCGYLKQAKRNRAIELKTPFLYQHCIYDFCKQTLGLAALAHSGSAVATLEVLQRLKADPNVPVQHLAAASWFPSSLVLLRVLGNVWYVHGTNYRETLSHAGNSDVENGNKQRVEQEPRGVLEGAAAAQPQGCPR